MTIANPQALWLLLALPLFGALAWRARHRQRRRLAQLGEVALLERFILTAPSRIERAAPWLWALAYAAFSLALARPQWGEETQLLPRRGLDVVFALDVSRSMRARDVLPDRLERAKAEIALLLDRIGENRVGLVVFAGTAFPLCPLTTDVEALRAFLRTAAPESVPQGGTALAEGLDASLQLFLAEAEADPAAQEAGRLLVVVSDGEDHEGDWSKVAEGLKEARIATYVIGVGSALGEPIPQLDEGGRVVGYHKDRRGQTVMSRMSTSLLEELARSVGGRFIDGSTREDLGMGDVESALSGLEKRSFDARIHRTGIDRSRWPLALGVFALALACGLAWTRAKEGQPARLRPTRAGRAAR